MKKLAFTITIAFFVSQSRAQIQAMDNEYPIMDKECPNFTLNNIEYYPKTQASLSDFKGKWLVLDFWSKNCTSCLASFPHINALKNQFSQKVQFMMVGLEDKENEVHTIFTKFHEKYNIDLPCSFDSLAFKSFDVDLMPYIIIINPTGIIKGITYSLDSNNIADFLSGKIPLLGKAFMKHEKYDIKYDHKVPFMVNKNGSSDDAAFLYRAILSKWDTKSNINSVPVQLQLEYGKFEVIGVDLNRLYMYAYSGREGIRSTDSLYGKFWPKPILEIQDKSIFIGDWVTGANLFCFSLSVPENKSSKEYLMNVLQGELKNCFGYNVKIETRKMPCWNLIASNEAKKRLKTKGGINDQPYRKIIAGFTVKNFPMRGFLRIISHDDIPFVDETGIQDNIDITMDCNMSDLNDIKRGLKANGLDLVKGEKEMKVIVISDI